MQPAIVQPCPRTLWTGVDASSSGAPQELTNIQRDGLGRARTWDRWAGAHFPSDFSPRCPARSPVLGCPRRACCGEMSGPAATCHACLTSDTPACRPTPLQACLQPPQPLWQSARSSSSRRSGRSWLRAPLFNSLHLPRAQFWLSSGYLFCDFDGVIGKQVCQRACLHTGCGGSAPRDRGRVHGPPKSRSCDAFLRPCRVGWPAGWQRAKRAVRDQGGCR